MTKNRKKRKRKGERGKENWKKKSREGGKTQKVGKRQRFIETDRRGIERHKDGVTKRQRNRETEKWRNRETERQ